MLFHRERESARRGGNIEESRLAGSGASVKFQARAGDKRETLTEVKNVK
jgi:hypothetical protein